MKKKAPKVSAKARRDALLRRITWRTKSTGNLSFPAIPGLVDHYVEVLEDLFAAMGRPFGKGAAASCRGSQPSLAASVTTSSAVGGSAGAEAGGSVNSAFQIRSAIPSALHASSGVGLAVTGHCAPP